LLAHKASLFKNVFNDWSYTKDEMEDKVWICIAGQNAQECERTGVK